MQEMNSREARKDIIGGDLKHLNLKHKSKPSMSVSSLRRSAKPPTRFLLCAWA